MATLTDSPAPVPATLSGACGPGPSPHMAEALALASLGEGRTAPNPPVGAVVVRDGRVVGRGYHPRAGEPHAEAFALRDAGDLARGATLYVTLEPCPHQGRTPPCTEAIAAAGVARVVCAAIDPNPGVRGVGVARLEALGIPVELGDGAAEADAMLRPYRRHVTTGLPYVVFKYAMSLDGRLAAERGAPLHLTGPEADAEVHALRDRLDAVAIGIGTAVADDPRLTVRRTDRPGRDPVRVVVDSDLRLPVTARLLHEGDGAVWVACRAPAPRDRRGALAAAGAQILELEAGPGDGDGVPLAALLAVLGSRGVMGLLLEGGPTLAATFARADAIDEVWAYVAPRMVGGRGGPAALGAMAEVLPADAFPIVDVRTVGRDVRIVLRREDPESDGEGAGPCSPESSKG